MSSLLKSTMNTRALPTGTMKYIRSDFPENLTEQEIKWLIKNNITTLVDLRSDDETVKKPCILKDREEFKYFNLPVAGGGGTPKSLEHLHSIYRNMLDAQMDKIIETIMNADSNVMYFCTAGKDRTGVVSAIILRRLGADDETIVEDYMKSGDNLHDMLTEYVKAHPEVDIEIVLPHRENIENVLKLL